MFGKLFGERKPAAPGPAAPRTLKVRRFNIEKRFTLISETGQGSMSHVYRALDNSTGRTICLKVQDKAKTAEAMLRSRATGRPTEGEIATRIVHPNVVRTFEFGESTRGEGFIVMEFIDGHSLNFVRESRSLKLGAKLELLAQAAEGLAAVHAAGFIHHDFGPKNVLVDRDDVVKLIDFGLAVPDTPAFHRPGNRTGTLQYMAPELVRREATDRRLDVFSFGVTAFEFLTNKLPYDGGDPMAMMRARINSDPADIGKVAPKLPEDLIQLIRQLLTRRKEDRIRDLASVAERLREIPAD